MEYYDWVIKYGENQECVMRSGYKYTTEESAKAVGEKFISNVNSKYINYKKPKIEVIKMSDSLNEKTEDDNMKWGIEITYSWGDEEPIIECDSKETAWTKAKEFALKETEIVSKEHDCFIGLKFNKDQTEIALYYAYDDEYCYYRIIEL
jgi:hypothetical protein